MFIIWAHLTLSIMNNIFSIQVISAFVFKRIHTNIALNVHCDVTQIETSFGVEHTEFGLISSVYREFG